MHEQRRQCRLGRERPAHERLADGRPVRVDGQHADTEPEFDALNYEFKHGINAYLKYLAAYAGDSDLELPGTLADDWGHDAREVGGKVVWFELAV